MRLFVLASSQTIIGRTRAATVDESRSHRRLDPRLADDDPVPSPKLSPARKWLI